MAYFDCIVGGSGKGNTLVVTCADELAGATITCTNGTKTYTKTCPSTSPYEVTFYGLTAGTWTVSATVSGNTYTTTVVVADIEALLGGFNWRTWVDTAQFLDSSDYDSLSEVLADEEAVRELCLEHACVDYLADIATASKNVETIINNDLFAKWVNNSDYALDFLHANVVIADLMDEADKYGYGEWVITDNTTTPPTWGPKGNVPVMTANNAPYGVTSEGSSYGTQYAAWKAFDGDASSTWAANHLVATGTASDTIVYKSVNPIKVKALYFYHDANKTTTQLIVSGSNDGTNYDPIKTISNPSVGMVSIDSDTYYLYHKVAVTQSNVTGQSYALPQLNTLQFYGRELKVSVPTMTGNTTPYGVASCSSYISNGYNAFNAFDNALTVGWLPNSSDSFGNAYVQFEFPSKVSVKKFYINKHTSDTVTFKVKASNDGTFTDIGDITDNLVVDGSYNVWKSFDVNTNNAKYFRAVFVDSTNPSHDITGGSGYDIQFFGLDYSEKEFESGTTKKWLYDHGLELETLDTSGTVTKGNNEIKLSAANAEATKTLDLTNFSLLRCIVGANMSGTTQLKAATTATANLTAGNAPNNNSLDVSAINQSLATGVKMTANGICDIEELWLE